MPTTPRYRAMNPLAVASIAVGPLSIATIFASTLAGWLMLTIIPLASVILGRMALKQIRKAPSEWLGRKLAWSGIAISAGLWLLGTCWILIAPSTVVPFGYTYIQYDNLQPDPNQPTMPIPQSALNIQDKKVYMKGYMQPRRQQTGIKEFILCPTNGECPFCVRNPKPTEMVRVILQGDLEAFYTTRLIRVAGRFRVDTDDRTGVPYTIEADILKN
jgi:hypothetical protein